MMGNDGNVHMYIIYIYLFIFIYLFIYCIYICNELQYIFIVILEVKPSLFPKHPACASNSWMRLCAA